MHRGSGLHIMLVDDAALASPVSSYLASHGHVVVTERCAEVTSRLRHATPDIMLVGSGDGGGDVLHLLPALRDLYPGGLLVMVAADRPSDRVRLLESADDVILPATPPGEVHARIGAVYRRTLGSQRAAFDRAGGGEAVEDTLPRDEWRLDIAARDLFAANGAPLGLTSAQFELLACLARTPGVPVTRESLALTALGRGLSATGRSIDGLVVGLRRKIASAGGPRGMIKSVRAVGYACTLLALRE
jgi:DNA-binding response OmpR family regulator